MISESALPLKPLLLIMRHVSQGNSSCNMSSEPSGDSRVKIREYWNLQLIVRCMGLLSPGGMSVIQSVTPPGDARGTVEVIVGGRGPVLVTGTESDECMMLKELAFGPKGKKGWICESEPMTEVPSGSNGGPWLDFFLVKQSLQSLKRRCITGQISNIKLRTEKRRLDWQHILWVVVTTRGAAREEGMVLADLSVLGFWKLCCCSKMVIRILQISICELTVHHVENGVWTFLYLGKDGKAQGLSHYGQDAKSRQFVIKSMFN